MIHVSAIELTTDCSTWPRHFGGSYFIQIDPESINSVFALFQFFLEPYYMNYWLLGSLTWSISQVHTRHSQGFWWTREMPFISGKQRKKGQISRGTETILGNREYKKTKIEGTEEQANLFQRNKETCTHPPWQGFAYHLGDRIPPK